MIVGTGGKRRSIPLGPLYEAVGEELNVKALPGFQEVIRQALSVEKAKCLAGIH